MYYSLLILYYALIWQQFALRNDVCYVYRKLNHFNSPTSTLLWQNSLSLDFFYLQPHPEEHLTWHWRYLSLSVLLFAFPLNMSATPILQSRRRNRYRTKIVTPIDYVQKHNQPELELRDEEFACNESSILNYASPSCNLERLQERRPQDGSDHIERLQKGRNHNSNGN